ncbi:MAG: hypothetical protein HYV09_09885 [Deltaproteobacteria bacterium]|nr:hypothetical protein [Deltaproteobacteria bacterium]
MSARADVLTAALVLRRAETSRNRNFLLHATPEAAEARKRAARIRGIVRQITGLFGPARDVTAERVPASAPGEIRLRYALTRIALVRETRLPLSDLSVLRVALARAGARLLPAPLLARDEDRARVDALLSELDAATAPEPAH